MIGVVVRDLSGQILDGRYRVIEPIGEGAMGSVYRAERLKLGRIVAIKVMNESLPDEMSSRRRFEREATAMAKLEHPHCASVLDIGVHDRRPYVVMDFVSGTNLTKLIEQGPVPIARAVEITRQVLSGLAHAHALGIVHRDIKPANVVLSQKAGLGDHATLLDFGLARLSEESSNLTSGVILGTPSYMAPEQIRGLLIDGRTDLYACGVMLFELLTGTKPFRSANSEPIEVCMMHITVPAPRLAEKLPGHEFGELETIVARALEKERDSRYATAEEFANALSALGGRPSYQTPPAGVMVPPPTETTVHLKDLSPMASAATSALVVDNPSPAANRAPSFSSPPLPPRPASRRRLVIAGGAIGVIAIVVLVVVGMTPKGSTSKAATSPPPLPADSSVVISTGPEPVTDVVGELVRRAQDLAASGRLKPAIDLLTKARRQHPEDARLPFHAGKLYVDKMYFGDGIPLIRSAFAIDPAYRSDPELIKSLLRGFNAKASYDGALARFLREDIGSAAKPYLEETASNHPNPIVRKRAAAELKRY